MYELVPRDFYEPVPVKRGTRKRVSQIQQEELVKRAAVEAAARDAVHQLEAREQLAAYGVERRIDNGYKLAARTVSHATQLNHLVTSVSRGNPGLELSLREIEDAAALGARTIIYQYMTRP